MSETTAKVGGVGKLFSWVKAAVMGLFGLCSGAVIMYVSPWVDRVVKPPRPVANFGVQVDGLQVTFVNQAEGHEGWWDFGDGSPLQPFTPDEKTFTHEYRKPGGYTARLTLRNLLGEENERAVNVSLDGTAAKPPAIDLFDVQPVDAKPYAPASYRVNTKVSNVDLCVWACGGDHPLEVVSDPPAAQEKFVTFVKPGKYTVKLAAVQGKQIVERSHAVEVLPAPFPTALAIVKVQNQVVPTKTLDRPQIVKVNFPDKIKGNKHAFTETIVAPKGARFVTAKFTEPVKESYIHDAKLTVADDGARVVLAGEYHPDKGDLKKKHATPHWIARIELTQQSTAKAEVKTGDPIVVQLKVPGTTLVPLARSPVGWKLQQRQIQLELRDGVNSVWNSTKMPSKTAMSLYNQPCLVTAVETGDQLRIDVQPDKNVPLFPPPLIK
jgi:hypothetical protein